MAAIIAVLTGAVFIITGCLWIHEERKTQKKLDSKQIKRIRLINIIDNVTLNFSGANGFIFVG